MTELETPAVVWAVTHFHYALSCSPQDLPPQCDIGQDEFQVAVVRSKDDVSATLEADPVQTSMEATDCAAEQCKDDDLTKVINFLFEGQLVEDTL